MFLQKVLFLVKFARYMLVITQLWNVAKLKQAFFDLKQHFHKIFASRYLILNISKLCSSSVGYKTLTKSQTSLPTVTTGTFSRHSSKMQKTIVLQLLYVHTLLQEHSGIATIKEQWCTLWSYCANAIVRLSGESAANYHIVTVSSVRTSVSTHTDCRACMKIPLFVLWDVTASQQCLYDCWNEHSACSVWATCTDWKKDWGDFPWYVIETLKSLIAKLWWYMWHPNL